MLCSARRPRMVARFRGSGAQSKGQEALLIPSQPCVCSRSLVCIFSLGFCTGILVFSFGWKPHFMFDRPLLDVPSDSSDTNVLHRQQQRFDPYFVHFAPTSPPSLT